MPEFVRFVQKKEIPYGTINAQQITFTKMHMKLTRKHDANFLVHSVQINQVEYHFVVSGFSKDLGVDCEVFRPLICLSTKLETTRGPIQG